MKTIKFRKKEYVIIERGELDKAIYGTNIALRDCESCAKHFKAISNNDDMLAVRYWFMNEIIMRAIEGRECLNRLLRKEG